MLKSFIQYQPRRIDDETKKIKLPQKPTLEDTVQAFSDWRKTRKHRTPIPQYLWDAAVSLLSNNSINYISKALHLSYTELKKRSQTQKDHSLQFQQPEHSFIELDIAKGLPSKGSVIEMENSEGIRMRMQIQGETFPLLLELGKSFMGKKT